MEIIGTDGFAWSGTLAHSSVSFCLGLGSIGVSRLWSHGLGVRGLGVRMGVSRGFRDHSLEGALVSDPCAFPAYLHAGKAGDIYLSQHCTA